MTFAPLLSRRPVAVALLLLAGFAAPWAGRLSHAANLLVSYEDAARQGLERTWFAQVPLDPSRSRVSSWYLYYDRLYCVTDSGSVTALNAETGAKLWTRQIGNSGIAAFGPDANADYLGVVSGSRIYLLERETGRVKWSRDLGGAPATGPALSKDYAYVALATGRIEGYPLADPKKQPWYYQSIGRTHLRPTTTGRVVSWPTTEGYLYASRADDPGVLYRLATGADIVTSPAQLTPNIYIASLDGYLYCLNELTGNELWRYSTGYPVMSSPAIVGKHAYVASIQPVLHCVDSTTGTPLWSVAGVRDFAAEGKERVYVADRYNNLLVLEAKTGSIIGSLKTAEGVKTLVNDQTDRIYLVNDHGLAQCLREIGAEEPLLHRRPQEVVDAEAAAADAAGTAPAAEGTPFVPEDAEGETPLEPAGEGQQEAEPAEDPAADGAPAEPAAEEGAVEENPFDDF